MDRSIKYIASLFTLALLIRLFFVQTYYGWEESDYGNLAMIYGVWDSGFTHYDMNHMPGYYFVAAVLYGLVQDSTVAGITVSVCSGVGSLYIVYRLAKAWGSINVAALATLGLLVQPEFALYASSSLREPLYTLYVLLAFQSLIHRKHWQYGLWGALAFSVRFEAPLFLIPMIFFVDWSWKEKWQAMSILLAAISGWMFYCHQVYETSLFWSHAASVNVETGLSAEATSGLEWWRNGFTIVFGLITKIATAHVGWGIMIAWMATPFIWWSSRNIRVCWIWSFLMTGVWLTIAFVAQHEVGHNLYWKWMYPLIPFWVLCAMLTLVRTVPKWGVGLVLLQAIVVQGIELKRQWTLSEDLYGPQVRLAQWMEEHLDPNEPLLVDNVPACWLRRDASPYTLHSWFDVPHFNDVEQLFEWAEQENVHWILFFKEEWTQAPLKASFFLEDRTRWRLSNGQIELVDQEEQYGWKWYRIQWDE